MYTQDGLSGIPGILSKDTFFGFFKEEGKANLVSGGRYRPFTLMMFALEWELFGRSPFVGHLVNILLYALLGVCIYLLLSRMLEGVIKKDDNKGNILLTVFLMSMVYIAHPIHTEAVANIKGRDEIMTMLGSVFALYALFRFQSSQKAKWNIIALVSFFIALMSKENAITFVAIAPLSLFFFAKQNIAQSIKSCWPLFISALVFIAIRTSILGFDMGGTPGELMNNPFLKLSGNTYVPFSFGEKLATIFYTLGKYIVLLFVPHPLSHDYYPRAVEIMNFSSWQSILSVISYLGLIFLAYFLWKKERIISYGILFYLLSLSIVSNLVFPIGTNMSERFLFMPSLGFAMVIVWLLRKYLPSEKVFMGACALLIVGYSFKTITRNAVWEDDFTLFTTDVKTQNRSAKLLNAAGGALSTKAAELPDGPEKTKMLTQAIGYLNQAKDIHPTYRNAYLLLGNSNYYLKNYQASIDNYDIALSYDPNFADAKTNLPIVLREGGKHMGQEVGDLNKALEWLLRSYELSPGDYETSRLIGVAYGIQKNNIKAIEFFKKAIELKPDLAVNYTSLATAYQATGNKEKAQEYYTKALEIDPTALDYLKNK